MPELPSGTVTFLFTDIEGSTARWEQHPQAMRQALARHDALLQEGISAHGGVVLTERGEGDSFFALFARPSDALAAACALQRALLTEAWPEEVAPIHVRMALHTGEAGMGEGQDYRGAAVNRCARLRAAAHGGQILLSGATYELVRDLLPAGVTLRDLGAHRLKDLTRPERIFQVLHPDLPAEFPPLTTLDRQRHNLPVQPTALIGREREVAAVRERLLEPDTRLLTLTGPGGTGKTRLALQVAAETLDAFPDGTYFVNLAPLSDPDLVLPSIAQTLGVREAGSQPLREALHAFLQDKRLLLVLDNFEQVLDGASVVADVLAACARVRVLVTSRAALHLRGERLYAVPPLTLPELTPPPPLERLTQYEAVRLFIARAQDVQPHFAVTNATAPAVAEICVRLDGLPLAIELVAARICVLPPQALLSRLSSRLTVVAGGAPDLPARQQTLRATIDWSYHLLTADEQRLFARLAVFVGGCTLQAVETVCNTAGTLDVLAGVESLVAKSLLHQEEGAAGEPRFGMLETLHEYARERLAASGEAEALRQAHALYYLVLAEQAGPQLTGPDRGTWLNHIEQEHDNLRATLHWTQHSGEVELGLRVAVALRPFWETSRHLTEGRAWVEGLLARAASGGHAVAASTRVKALQAAGVFAWMQGAFTRAAALHEASRDLAEKVGDKRSVASALDNLGTVAAEQDDYERAEVLYQESLALFREVGDIGMIAWSLHNQGDLAAEHGDYERAEALYQESLSLFQEQGDTANTIMMRAHLAEVAHYRGDDEQAAALYEDCLAWARQVESTRDVAHWLSNLGRVVHQLGNTGKALGLYAESVAVHRTLGDRHGIARGLEGAAGVAGALGDAGRAARLYGAAAALRAAIGAPLPLADRARYERDLTAVRVALGDEAFGAAWAAGQALPLEQAIAEVLREIVPA